MKYFSRAQHGVILLLGAALFLLWAWRANFWRPYAQAPAPPQPVFVEVTGAATITGVFAFPTPPTLSEVWRTAGGPQPVPESPTKLTSGSRLELTQEGSFQLTRMSGAQLMTLGLPIDINTATKEDLEALPGIGPVLAGRIVEYRRIHGPFKRVGDLIQVSGIGPKKLAQLTPHAEIKTQPREAD